MGSGADVPLLASSSLLSVSSSALHHAEVLAVLLRLEAVAVAAAAAVPEAGTFALLRVEEPHHDVVLAAALVLSQEAGVWGGGANIRQREAPRLAGSGGGRCSPDQPAGPAPPEEPGPRGSGLDRLVGRLLLQ